MESVGVSKVQIMLYISVCPLFTPFGLKQYPPNIAVKTHDRPPRSKQKVLTDYKKAIVWRSIGKQPPSGHVLSFEEDFGRTKSGLNFNNVPEHIVRLRLDTSNRNI